MDHSIRRRTTHQSPVQPRQKQLANIQLHNYEITTVPANVRAEDAEMLAEAKKLPRIQFKAISADAARKTAMHVLRDRIYDVTKLAEKVPS